MSGDSMYVKVLGAIPAAGKSASAAAPLQFERRECAPMFTLLATRASHAVPRASLLSAAGAFQSTSANMSISNIRKHLASALGVPGTQLIPGMSRMNETYALRIDPSATDFHHFNSHCDRALACSDEGEVDQALFHAEEALNLAPTSLVGVLHKDAVRGDLQTTAIQINRHRDLAAMVKINALVTQESPSIATEFAENYIAVSGSQEDRLWTAFARALIVDGRDATIDRLLTGDYPGAVPRIVKSIAPSIAKLRQDPVRRHPPSVSPFVEPIDQRVSLEKELEVSATSPKGRLVIVSGVSSAGKDTIVHFAQDRAQDGMRFEILKKFTTRAARDNDPSYVTSVSAARFKELVDEGRILWPYEKRSVGYGFDQVHLNEAFSSGRLLVAIFTDFERVPRITHELRDAGTKVVNILLKVDPATFRARSWLRGFSRQEAQLRLDSAFYDMERLSTTDGLESFYVVIGYNNDRDVLSATDEFLAKVQESLES